MASAMEHGFGLLLLRVWPLATCKCIAGEEPATGIVASITPGHPTLVTCVDDERMDFQASSSVTCQCQACLMHSSACATEAALLVILILLLGYAGWPVGHIC